jgi:hypothetical protein
MGQMQERTFKFMEELIAPKDLRHNKLMGEDRAFHDWYRFVLSFPPHLVSPVVCSWTRSAERGQP